MPENLGDRHVFLDFSGINWKADVYFNSKYLGKIEGAYIRAGFEVSQLLDKTGVNTFAVLVRHPEHWESSTHKVTEKILGTRTTNGDVLGFDSPACLASAGWKIKKGKYTPMVIVVPDANTGRRGYFNSVKGDWR